MGAVAALALLALFFRGMDWAALRAAFATADRGFLLAVAGITVVTYVARAWRWGYLLAPLAHVRLWRLFTATVVGFMTALFVPRAGEVVRPYLIGRRHNVSTSAAFASIILERVVDLLTVLLLFGVALKLLPLGAPQASERTLHALEAAGVLGFLGALGVLAVLVALHWKAAASLALAARLLSPLPTRFASAIHGALASFAAGLGVLQASTGHLLAIVAPSFLVWLSIAAGIYFNNRAFGLHLPFQSAFVIIGFLTVGVAIPTPGAVGGYHETYLLALTQVYGVDKGTAAAAGIAGHALTNLPVLLFGLLFLPGEGLSFGKVAQMTESASEDKPDAGGRP
jgi:uncharacterized protein (TIRG00374 family)